MSPELWNSELCRERRRSILDRAELEAGRLRQMERTTAKLSEVSVQLSEIIRFQKEQIDEHSSRLRELEKAPGKTAELAKNAAISAIVSGLIAYVITVLF